MKRLLLKHKVVQMNHFSYYLKYTKCQNKHEKYFAKEALNKKAKFYESYSKQHVLNFHKRPYCAFNEVFKYFKEQIKSLLGLFHENNFSCMCLYSRIYSKMTVINN